MFPDVYLFRRLIKRFVDYLAITKTFTDRRSVADEAVERVRNLFQCNRKAPVKLNMLVLDPTFGILTTVRRVRKYKAYRYHPAQVLSPSNTESKIRRSGLNE